MPATTDVFALPEHLAAKADPALIDADRAHLSAIAAALAATIADVSERLAAERRAPGGGGQEALERDQQIHRLSARLRTLNRYGADLCLGRMVATGGAVTYVGRTGLRAPDGERLLVDWRSPAAEPFFAATHAEPLGLASRRRYRWKGEQITDYWDEAFTDRALHSEAALDDQSAFIASLGADRSPRMRDVLGTIQADQDAIIRAPSEGALVVDGGPGTGKTVVALHRAAYLLYSDPRIGRAGHGGLLVVGPHHPYLDYVSDVLPSLGEEGVRLATLADLVPVKATQAEDDHDVAVLKQSRKLVEAIDPAVAFYEDPPAEPTRIELQWADLRITPDMWAEAFRAGEGPPHNEAQEAVWEELLTILTDALGTSDDDVLRATLARNRGIRRALERAWPVLEPADVVGDLWSVPAYLRMAAPWLSREQIAMLQRSDPQAWTVEDLPLLDAARTRLGDPEASERARARQAALANERERMDDVVEHLIDTDDSDMQIMSMLRGQDLRGALAGADALPEGMADPFAGPFAHVIVDEAQELSDAQWQMIRARCPSGSLTLVGDRAQARRLFAETWEQRLHRVGLAQVCRRELGVNYRTPAEVMAEAEPVIRAAIPDVNVPASIRPAGAGVHHGRVSELPELLTGWVDQAADGVACVICPDPAAVTLPADDRVRALTPARAKGLEFDLVVLIHPESLSPVDRYVAMTRATGTLAILT